MSTQLEIVSDAHTLAPATALVITPMEMLARAVERGADIATIERLAALAERFDAIQARKAFDDAISAAKAEIPPIVKTREVDFTSQKGRTNYRHEDFAGIARVVDPILSKHGISYRHRSSQDGNKLRVTCVMSHRLGYSEETSLEALEDHTGNKNSIQAIGSSATYLQRYTLKLALGLSTTSDDDGAASNGIPKTIGLEEAETLTAKIEAAGGNVGRFCQRYRIEALSDLPRAKLPYAEKEILERARINREGR